MANFLTSCHMCTLSWWLWWWFIL